MSYLANKNGYVNDFNIDEDFIDWEKYEKMFDTSKKRAANQKVTQAQMKRMRLETKTMEADSQNPLHDIIKNQQEELRIARDQIAKMSQELEELKSLKNNNLNQFKYLEREASQNKENNQPECKAQASSIQTFASQASNKSKQQFSEDQDTVNSSLNFTRIILEKCAKNGKEGLYKQKSLGEFMRFHKLLNSCSQIYGRVLKTKMVKMHEFLRKVLDYKLYIPYKEFDGLKSDYSKYTVEFNSDCFRIVPFKWSLSN